jgi:HEAT repeat protein
MASENKQRVSKADLDKAFDALKDFDWGKSYDPLRPIDVEIVATEGDAAARKELEVRLAAFVKGDGPRAAKDFACRKLMVIGTAESVPTLAALLGDKDLSHMARYALERIPAPEAAQAMREALPNLAGPQKAGAIGSLGVRRDTASVAAIAGQVTDSDAAVAKAAACALGDIGTVEAAKALADAAGKASDAGVKVALADARLVCAEQLTAAKQKAAAMAIYKALSGADQPKHVRLAATRGLLSAAKKD